uniref:peroxidase n=1 Tax=Strongyloides stercoralis TaxID=6248 RepID=A0A913I157_STRER
MLISMRKISNWRIKLVLIAILLFNIIETKDDSPITKNFKCRRNGCCDQHEWCRFWASAGECLVNKKWMEENCQLACNACKRLTPKVTTTKKVPSKIPVPEHLLPRKKVITPAKLILSQSTTRRPFKAQIPSNFNGFSVISRLPKKINLINFQNIPKTSQKNSLNHALNFNNTFKFSHTTTIFKKSKFVTTTIQPLPTQKIFKMTHIAQTIIPHSNGNKFHNNILSSTPVIFIATTPLTPTIITTPTTTNKPIFIQNTNISKVDLLPNSDSKRNNSFNTKLLLLDHNTMLNNEESNNSFNNDIFFNKTLTNTSSINNISNNSFILPIDKVPNDKTQNLKDKLSISDNLKHTTQLPNKIETKHGKERINTNKSQPRSFLLSTFTTPASSHLTISSNKNIQTKETPILKTTLRPVIQTIKSTLTSLQQTTVSPIKKSKNVLGSKIEMCKRLLNDPTNIAINIKKNNLIFSSEDNDGRRTIGLDDVIRSNLANACTPRLDEANCERNLCYNLYFRTMDGTCNNLEKPLQGASYRPYNRLLPPEYDDGLGAPVSSIKNNKPSPREINRVLLSSNAVVHAEDYNSLLMQFGQFISHDMAKTTLVPSSKCPGCKNVDGRCMAIKLSPNETNAKFLREGCIKISRSSPICGSGRTKPRQQLNENTGYIDGSPIYGSSVSDLQKFRQGKTPFLKLSNIAGQKTLPFDQSRCKSDKSCTVIFIAGDSRVNLFIGLSSIHILFNREHNRIAGIFKRINPHWSDERVFQETRKLVGAQIQAIVYREYLPKILGSAFMSAIGPYKGYNPNVDATIINEFTSSAFRYGHGMIQEAFPRLGANFKNISFGSYNFVKGTLNSQLLVKQGGIDPILRGMMFTKLKRPQRLTNAITENMFESTDLGSINIQRGRDHGLPSYNKFRELCGLKLAKTLDDISNEILSPLTRNKLLKMYGSIDNIDLFVGAILEDPVLHGLVGPTITCIIGPQFKRTRDGDRFYYENPGIFTPNQLKEIRKSSFSRLLCDNGDNINLVTKEAFRISSLTSCSQIPQMDLSKWKE